VNDEKVEVGKGTKIWHFSHVLKNSKFDAVQDSISGWLQASDEEIKTKRSAKRFR
jgi:hypothetical protein